ncbi:MAG: PilZ domain-containing protein [Spirochaetales bacterium]|nr:PilZ domain-containing protein [Spirochaetales bacterium]
MDIERRADPRINQTIKIDVIPHVDDRFPVETVTTDTSPLGIGFICDTPFHVGQELSIVYIPEDAFTTITKTALVKHVTPVSGRYRIGAEFY